MEFSSTKLSIQLDFEQALYVSFEEADMLVVEFADPDLFLTDDGIRILPENRRLERPLMKQIPNSAKGAQENINSSAESSKSVTSAIMIGNIFLGVGLQTVLDMINAL